MESTLDQWDWLLTTFLVFLFMLSGLPSFSGLTYIRNYSASSG
jgi:hypothetical protein